MTISYCSQPSHPTTNKYQVYYYFTQGSHTLIIKENITLQGLYAFSTNTADGSTNSTAVTNETNFQISMTQGVYTIDIDTDKVHIIKKTATTISKRNYLERTSFDSTIMNSYKANPSEFTAINDLPSANRNITDKDFTSLVAELVIVADTENSVDTVTAAKVAAINLLMNWDETFLIVTAVNVESNRKPSRTSIKPDAKTVINIEGVPSLTNSEGVSCFIIKTTKPAISNDLRFIQNNLIEIVKTISELDNTFYNLLLNNDRIISIDPNHDYTPNTFSIDSSNVINNTLTDRDIYIYDTVHYNTSNFLLKSNKTYAQIFPTGDSELTDTIITDMINYIESPLTSTATINSLTIGTTGTTTLPFTSTTSDASKKIILLNLHSYYSSLKHMKYLLQYERLKRTVHPYNMNKILDTTDDIYDPSLKNMIDSLYTDINNDLDQNTTLKTGAFSQILLNTKDDYTASIGQINEIILDSAKNANSYDNYISFHNILSHDSILYDYLLYIVIIYILLTIIFFIYTSMNVPDKMIPYIYISLTITIVFYIITALLSFFNTTTEQFSANETHNTIYINALRNLRSLSTPYRDINNTVLGEFVAIIEKETNEKTKKADIDKLVSQYNLNKIKSINNNEKHSSKFNKDFTELLYMLLIILLVGILLYDSFNNIYIVGCIIVPIYCILITSFFLNMHRKTRVGFNQIYW
jgi:hypothetical protein